MSETAQFETDEFLKLLTDALRAGPGSPQWHEAVMRLREQGSGEADEYRLLIEARQHLESGREYRSVRAGPGFTRKVMDTLEEESARPRRPVTTATVIFLLAAALILGVVVSVAVMLLKSEDAVRTIQDLRATSFSTAAISSSFSSDIPAEWRAFGIAPVVPQGQNVLRSGPHPAGAAENEIRGGGIVSATSFAPDQAFQVDLSAMVGQPTDQVVLQLFVTDRPQFDGAKEAATPSELAITLRRNELVVVKPDGRIVGESGRIEPRRAVHVVLRIDARHVIVEDGGGRELYAGEHGLSPERPRHPGLRFLSTGKGSDQVTVQSLRVMKP